MALYRENELVGERQRGLQFLEVFWDTFVSIVNNLAGSKSLYRTGEPQIPITRATQVRQNSWQAVDIKIALMHLPSLRRIVPLDKKTVTPPRSRRK